MKRSAFSLVVLLCAVPGLAVGQLNVAITEYTLPNGLHVVLHEDHSAPIVAQVISYHVGSKNEQPDRTGFAHFFEHLMFEGTTHIPRGEFTEIVENAGGSRNAFTSFDQTVFFISVPTNQLELAMWMESDRMINLLVDSVGIETQRAVVKEERKQGIDNQPYGSILEQTFSHAFSVHPYRWTPIGSAQYIDQATYDEFREFYKTYYVPENASLVIAGDIEPRPGPRSSSRSTTAASPADNVRSPDHRSSSHPRRQRSETRSSTTFSFRRLSWPITCRRREHRIPTPSACSLLFSPVVRAPG